MKRILLIATAALLGSASAAGGGPTTDRTASGHQAPTITYRTYHYSCDGGKKISAAYLNFGKDGPSFVVLTWNGQQYGLAEAVSASGARYASLYGPTVSGGGLEWWEHQGEATFSTFVGSDTRNTRPLLTHCKPGR